jgi:hypothetical protein
MLDVDCGIFRPLRIGILPVLNEGLSNITADEGPAVEVDGVEEDADGMMDEVDTGLAVEDEAWVLLRLSGSYTKDDVTG